MFQPKTDILGQVNFSIRFNAVSNPVDYCINSDSLNEFYCEENTTFKSITRDCGMENKVCSDGACVSESTTNVCKDSDVPGRKT
jgi:hypothetical protein